MAVAFEKLVSRSIVRFLSNELDLAGVKMTVEKLLSIIIIGDFVLFIGLAIGLDLVLKMNIGIAALGAIAAAAIFDATIYLMLELKIDGRKGFIETILPDYLQLTAANVRSGIALDKAMVIAARPEFKYFSDDVRQINKQLYAGETLQNSLLLLAKKYRSLQLQHTMRMIIEAIQYGGGMTDLLNQIAKDVRNQQTIQKEISGQLFMYTIFIAFASLIGAPVLYALTTQMISVTDTVWAGILKQNPNGLPTTGVSFLKPSAPKITIDQYRNFAYSAVILITGLGAFTVSVISSGSVLKGIRFLPVFILLGLAIFYITSTMINTVFTSIGTV